MTRTDSTPAAPAVATRPALAGVGVREVALGSLGGRRERQRERRSRPHAARHREIAAHAAREPARERQPEADALLSHVAGLELLEQVEDALVCVGRNAGPGVADVHLDDAGKRRLEDDDHLATLGE